MTRKIVTYILLLYLTASEALAQNKVCFAVVPSDSLEQLFNCNIEFPALKKKYQVDSTGVICIVLPNKSNYLGICSASNFNSKTFYVNHAETNGVQKIVLQKEGLQLQEIIVTGFLEQEQKNSAESTVSLNKTEMTEKGALNLSDALSKLPGMRQLTTGPGISKPVIRGLYGNRVQVILFGLRFDNQQWQDEHGLGITTAGIAETEIIKGPASLYYGSEAMGGVINILPEKNAGIGTTEIDIGTSLFSNTYGYACDAGVKHASDRVSWGIRLNSEAHADYSDGNGLRILNSRFGSNTFKAFLQFDRKKIHSRTTYYFSQANFGFLMDAFQQYETADNRTARNFERPHHSVFLNLLSSENTVFLKASQLKVNLGLFFNNRQEQEGAGGISLNMLLNSYSAMISWHKKLQSKTDLVISNQNLLQTNTNIGSRTIVPDATILENSLAAFIAQKETKYQLELGLRYDYRSMQTKLTGVLNNGNPFKPGQTILPTYKQYSTANAAVGASFFPLKHFTTKLNFCSGYRSPNLAEFSSNGLHEGSLRYEIGNTSLKVEQNLCAEFSANYKVKAFTIWLSSFYNRFLNYIYLQRTNEEYLGFTIYRYQQNNAVLIGAETGIQYENKLLLAKADFSFLNAKTLQGDNLPFIPANRIQTELKIKFANYKTLLNSYARIQLIYVLAQNTPAQFESATPGYHLFSMGAGTKVQCKKNLVDISINGNNLLNEVYADHLSRLKYFDLFDIGRNVSINLRFYIKP